jgi:hypothetical protein
MVTTSNSRYKSNFGWRGTKKYYFICELLYFSFFLYSPFCTHPSSHVYSFPPLPSPLIAKPILLRLTFLMQPLKKSCLFSPRNHLPVSPPPPFITVPSEIPAARHWPTCVEISIGCPGNRTHANSHWDQPVAFKLCHWVEFRMANDSVYSRCTINLFNTDDRTLRISNYIDNPNTFLFDMNITEYQFFSIINNK